MFRPRKKELIVIFKLTPFAEADPSYLGGLSTTLSLDAIPPRPEDVESLKKIGSSSNSGSDTLDDMRIANTLAFSPASNEFQTKLDKAAAMEMETEERGAAAELSEVGNAVEIILNDVGGNTAAQTGIAALTNGHTATVKKVKEGGWFLGYILCFCMRCCLLYTLLSLSLVHLVYQEKEQVVDPWTVESEGTVEVWTVPSPILSSPTPLLHLMISPAMPSFLVLIFRSRFQARSTTSG